MMFTGQTTGLPRQWMAKEVPNSKRHSCMSLLFFQGNHVHDDIDRITETGVEILTAGKHSNIG